MLLTVEFDDEPVFNAYEVRHIWTYRMLAAKAETQ